MDYFKQQDRFHSDMLKANRSGIFDKVFDPYFRCMQSGVLFSLSETYSILDAASDELDKIHAQGQAESPYQELINGINAEVTNLLRLTQ